MTPESVIEALTPIATTGSVAVLLDLDALPARALDRGMMHVLEALVHSKVHVAIVPPRDSRPMFHVSGATYLARDAAVGELRARDPEIRLLSIGNEARLVAALRDTDRIVALRLPADGERVDVFVPGAISLRAMLWWLVDARTRSAATH